MAVTYPTVIYGQGSTIDEIPRLIRTKMGDGNQQVIVDGINAIDTSGTIEHPLIDQATQATLRSFYRTNIGQVVTIKNLMQDYTGATTMNVIITGWQESNQGEVSTFTVDFEKVNRTT